MLVLKPGLKIATAAFLLIFSGSSLEVFSQEKSETDPKVTNFKPQIIPPHPDAVGGGNPFQGLGRPDDPGTSRVQEFLDSVSSQKQDASGKAAKTKKKESTSTAGNTSTKKDDSIGNKNKSKESSGKKNTTSPLEIKLSDQRLALQLIQKRQYSRALSILEKRKKSHPTDYKSKYLLAITYVLIGKNEKARVEYKDVILNSFNLELVELAKKGLKKITPQN